ncbi:MAG TPA: cytosine deaminase, partial [Ramlibacter sp.]|nr:cytosine deaminase [Ramlibacter sp.]
MKTLIRGATLVTMDAPGDVPGGDLLLEDDRIAAIVTVNEGSGAPSDLARAADEIVDARGCIVIPGLVNAHMHTWQTALRGLAANWTLLEYFQKMHAGLATVFTPDDLHIATLAGA